METTKASNSGGESMTAAEFIAAFAEKQELQHL